MEVKFDYIIKTTSGIVKHLTFDYLTIFNGVAKSILTGRDDCHIIAKRQFSGMKDRYDKDIYEGDILELINDEGEPIISICEHGVACREVVTVSGDNVLVDIYCFYFRINKTEIKTFPIIKNYAGKHDLEILKIIGNIYENPELLK